MYVAHEFFDALPVHKFVKINNEWREILVDALPPPNATSPIDGTPIKDSDNAEASHPLRFIVSRSATPASKLYTSYADTESRKGLEVSPDAILLLQSLCKRLKENGGALMAVDYGHSGEKEDTLRSFSNHLQVHPLASPGEADITCDVDFSLIKGCVPDSVITYGPVPQSFFLKNMGIELRLTVSGGF